MKALSKRIKHSLVFFFFVVASTASSFVPNASQVGRFQPGLLNRYRSFSSSGHVEFQGNKMAYVLEWYGPESYRVSISQISPSVYSSGQGSNVWLLTRHKTLCLFKAGNKLMNCPSPQAWALLELSGVPEAGARGLYSAEILETREIAFQETDATLLAENGSDNRVQLVVARDGKTPVAELELKGPNVRSVSEGEDYPLIRFDQTFLAPTFLRMKQGGEVFSIAAQSDLEVKRGRSRFTWVLANTLSISSNIQQSLGIVRGDPSFNSKLSPPKTEKSLSQIETFKEELSVPGLFLLEAVLLTH